MKNKSIQTLANLGLIVGMISTIDIQWILLKHWIHKFLGVSLEGFTSSDYLLIFIWLIFILGLTIHTYLQRLQKKNMNSIVTQYYPPEWIKPWIAGYLENNKFDSTDLLALIFDRGARWLIQIESIPSGYLYIGDSILIHKLQDINDPTSGEGKIWTELFEQKSGFNFDAIKYRRTEEKRITFFEKVEEYMIHSTSKFYKSPHFFNFFEHIWWLFWGRYYNSQWKDMYRNIVWYREFIKHIDLSLLQDLYQSDPSLIDSIIPWAISFELTKSFNKKLQQLPHYIPPWHKHNNEDTVRIIESSLKSISRWLTEAKRLRTEDQ